MFPGTVGEAQRLLNIFLARPAPALYEFATNPRADVGLRDARDYLEAKESSRLAIVNFSEIEPQGIRRLGEVIEAQFALTTDGAFSVDVDVIEASLLARAVHRLRNGRQGLEPSDLGNYGAAIAEATMPEVHERYTTVMALTDSLIDPASGLDPGLRGIAMVTGRYADVLQFTDFYRSSRRDQGSGTGESGIVNDDVRDLVIHEWLHAHARLEHAKAMVGPDGDLVESASSSRGTRRSNLGEFVRAATVAEYGDFNIMGTTFDLYEHQALSVAQQYLTEAAERALGRPTRVRAVELAAGSRVVLAGAADLALFRLRKPIDAVADSGTLGVNTITTVVFSRPRATGLISVGALTDANATIHLGTIPTMARDARFVLELPGGVTLSVSRSARGPLLERGPA